MKSNKVFLLIVVVLVLVVFSSKSLLQPNKNENDVVVKNVYSNAIMTDYNNLKNSGKPSVAVITYDADCCPGTKQFFVEYKETVELILLGYGNEISSMFINYGDVPVGEAENLQSIIQENGVLVIPAILILDKQGDVVHLVEGPFLEDDVKRMIDEVLR